MDLYVILVSKDLISVNFFFRADSSSDIGTGHVMRCLTLALALRDAGHSCIFICKNHQGNISNYILKNQFELIEINTNPYKDNIECQPDHYPWLGSSFKDDANQTNAILEKRKPDWLIVDHYAIDFSWHKEVLRNVKRIMVIDDLGDRRHECNILLDQNLGATEIKYKKLLPKDCKKLLGPKYALLRPEFYGLRKSSMINKNKGKLNRILINFGGGDKLNLTKKVLKKFTDIDLPKYIQIDVILGPQANLDSNITSYKDFFKDRIRFFKDITNMAELMMSADLAISAGGSTSWERCALGLPSIIFAIAENQIEIAKNIEKSGAGVYLPIEALKSKEFEIEFQKFYFNDVLLEYSKSAANITKGNGVKNLINIFND